ncbi:hypothetical protein [Pseudonocardia alni]|uniref:hypothetical protein n=1 Tax=Pseudonocardia alni TaxID=33907 RepID=UPI001AD635DB|nr:hypothetical protein [Pseudonocardia alni]MBO4236831.1 hypothetical protein [Pseudonocardia alni]
MSTQLTPVRPQFSGAEPFHQPGTAARYTPFAECCAAGPAHDTHTMNTRTVIKPFRGSVADGNLRALNL